MNWQLLFFAACGLGLSTIAGTVGGLLVKKVPHKYNDVILGAASGIMLGAAILGLISPAAEIGGKYTLLLVAAGVLAGASLVSILDRITPHLHRLAGLDAEEHKHNGSISKILLFVSAIAIHKFPEGLAAGVSFGTGMTGDILTVTGGIALQNIPEAMVIVSPLLTAGVSIKRTLLISLAIALISMTGTILGGLLVNVTTLILPFILAFAGGTMLYVVSDEMIPETHSHGYEKAATFSILGGFLLILVMQKLLGA